MIATSMLILMGVLVACAAMVAVLAFTLWRLGPRGGWLAASGAWLIGQAVIWSFANELDNGAPWNFDRPLLTSSSDPLWIKPMILLALYGPLVMAIRTFRKAWR